MDMVKLVVFVPTSHADKVREAMGKAGAGVIGKYGFCSFSTKGTGRFLPHDGAHPAIGTVGEFESVEEERIETVCPADLVAQVTVAIKKVHPYEEVAFDVYPLLEV
jgi:hypothetical protein